MIVKKTQTKGMVLNSYQAVNAKMDQTW